MRSIFSKAKLPAGYYHRANFTTNCKTLGTPATKDEFKFCEDATFWDIHNKGGELSERKVVVSCDASAYAALFFFSKAHINQIGSSGILS